MPENRGVTVAVRSTIFKMKNGKATGCLGIIADMLKAAGEVGVRMVAQLINAVVRKEKVPDDWQKSVIL